MMHPHARPPVELEAHREAYRDESWREYSIEELGNIVSFFVKRSAQRSDPVKRRRDLYDASNYMLMIRSHVNAHISDAGGPPIFLAEFSTPGEVAQGVVTTLRGIMEGAGVLDQEENIVDVVRSYFEPAPDKDNAAVEGEAYEDDVI